MAAEFLHHVAYVNLDEISFKERVERYDVMGDLYHQLSFHRKASFFKRVAAMHCVNPQLPSPAWSECYDLILQSFPGFRMSFDPNDYQQPGQTTGWPGIRLRVYHELIFAARQLGNNAIVIRHISLCLHTMFSCMMAKEIVDLVHLLQTYTDVQNDDGAIVITKHEISLPPIPFTDFPLLSSFDVMKLPPQLEAHKLKQVTVSDSVFIYSPLNIPRKDSRTQLVTEYEFCWVQDNPGTVEVHLHNPLPLELKITDFSLIVDGARFQSYPSSHALPPESGPHIINIVGTPTQRGTLKIMGYQMSLFGVLSRCLFSELSHLPQNQFVVDIAPILPSIHVSSELPKSPYMVTGGDNKVVTSAILQIYVGEERKCSIKLKNNSNVSIVKISSEFSSDKYQDLVSRFLSLDMTEVEAALPLVPGEETELTITTNGTLTLADLPNQALMSPGGSSDDIHRASSALIESMLTISYTGAQGDMDKYYRECVMSLDVVVIPSINILSQNITSLGADSCHVVYEVFNESNMALDVKSGDKLISLKPMQSDRVYSTLDKCDSGATLASCKKAIDESVSMVWTSKDTHRQGLISADNIVWKDTELDKLRRRPFSVTGSVTKNACSRYSIGEPIELSYHVTNTSGLEYSNIELKFLVSQESTKTHSKVEEGQTFIALGQSDHHITQLAAEQSIELKHCLIIFFAGQYTIECQCYHRNERILDIDPGITLMIT